MSLEGSWDFTIESGGDVYRCRVSDDRIEITAPSGMTMDAKWDGSDLVNWCGFEGDIADEVFPDDVIEEATEQMRGMAEAEDS